jgi:hypothetical protein
MCFWIFIELVGWWQLGKDHRVFEEDQSKQKLETFPKDQRLHSFSGDKIYEWKDARESFLERGKGAEKGVK